MSTELRLDAVICDDGKEPEFSSLNEKVNAVQKLLDGFLQQGKWSSNNISTPKERRLTSDNRFSRANRAAPDNNADDKREHGSGRNLGPLLSGTAHCISSCSMIFLSKVVHRVKLSMQIISAITGGITDLSFDSLGYAWQISNCILTASYSLTLRRVMDKPKLLTDSGSLNEFSMVLQNNLLSLPFAILLILLFNAWDYVVHTVIIRMPMFWVVATASGVLGHSISFTSMWFLNQTGPTSYSRVGSLNKIPISIAGIMLFKVPVSLPNLFSILFGLFAGVFFAKAKMP